MASRDIDFGWGWEPHVLAPNLNFLDVKSHIANKTNRKKPDGRESGILFSLEGSIPGRLFSIRFFLCEVLKANYYSLISQGLSIPWDLQPFFQA